MSDPVALALIAGGVGVLQTWLSMQQNKKQALLHKDLVAKIEAVKNDVARDAKPKGKNKDASA